MSCAAGAKATPLYPATPWVTIHAVVPRNHLYAQVPAAFGLTALTARLGAQLFCRIKAYSFLASGFVIFSPFVRAAARSGEYA